MFASLVLAASIVGQTGVLQNPGPPIFTYWAGPVVISGSDVEPLLLVHGHPGPAGVRNLRMGGAYGGRGDVGVGPAFRVVNPPLDAPAGWYPTANVSPWYLYAPAMNGLPINVLR